LSIRTSVAVVAALLVTSCNSTPLPTYSVAAADAPVRRGERVLDWPWQESDLQPDPNTRYGKLPNGMRYAIRANRNQTATASFRLRFDVGSLMEADDQRGLAHFLEHMAFNGSANVPEGEMIRLLQRRGLSFGAHTNAYTSFDETVYMLEAPNTQAETLDTVFMLMRELGNLTIASDAVDRERGVILSEERSRNTPGLRAAQAQWNALFPNARFPKRMPIGAADVIRNAPPQRLRDLYESFYRPERAFFVVSGDIDVGQMEAKIRATFSDWRPARPDPGDPELGNGDDGAASGYFYDPGLPTSVQIAAVHPAEREANTVAQVRRNFLRGIGNAIVTRRLIRLARASDATFQSGQASTDEMYDTVNVSTIELATQAANWQAAIGTAEQEVRRAVEFGFTQAEIDEQIARYRTSFRTSAEQAATRTSSELANEIVGEFGHWGVDMDPADELVMFERLAPDLTRTNVHAAFRALWANVDPRLFLGSGTRIENAAEQQVAAYVASRRLAVSAPADQTNVQFAYTNFGAVGSVAERREIADLGITTVRFANNVRLNLKHTDFTDNSVLVSVRFGSGTLELPGAQPGLGMLLQSLPEGGLQAHSADDLQSILAGRNVQTRIGAAADAFALSGATTPGDLELQLQLMAAYLTHPGYRGEALQRFRQNMANQYPSIAATPSGVVQRDVPRLLRSGDARYGIPGLTEINARSFDELRAALQHASSHGAIEIGIVGDVEVEQTIQLVGRTFGALPARDAAEPSFAAARAITFPQGARQATILRHEGQANRGMALTYWPTTDDSNARTMRTLELLRAVMSVKLIERVRESEGATYSPLAQAMFSHANPGYGYLGVSLDLEPQNVNRFFGIVDEIAASLAAGDISADELERARRPIVDDFRNSQEDNRYWMSLVATAQTNAGALARHRATVADYEAVTIVDLRTAARRYLVPSRAYRVAVLPGPAL